MLIDNRHVGVHVDFHAFVSHHWPEQRVNNTFLLVLLASSRLGELGEHSGVVDIHTALSIGTGTCGDKCAKVTHQYEHQHGQRKIEEKRGKEREGGGTIRTWSFFFLRALFFSFSFFCLKLPARKSSKLAVV